MPARRRGRGARAARAGLGGAPRQLARRRRRGGCGWRSPSSAAAPAEPSRLRRGDRRLPGPLRPSGRKARRAGRAGRLQPARLARRHVRRRPRALPPGLASPRARSPPSTATRSARPTSSSPTRRQAPITSPSSARSPDRVEVCFVGAEERVFRPGWSPAEPFTVPLRRQADPAARRSRRSSRPRGSRPSSAFRARRQRASSSALARERPANVELVPWVEYERLPGELHRAGCALGIFGTSAKAARVIPNKAFQALACGTPLVTADTPAARELLVDGESALLVPPGDPEALAAALRRLAGRRRSSRSASPQAGRAAYRGAARARRSSAAAGASCSSRRSRAMIRPRALLWAAIAAYAAGFSALSILRHRAFSTGRFDLGNMVAGGLVDRARAPPRRSPASRGDQVSRLGAHFDPILAAFAPLWLVWPSPDLLLVAQAVAVALGALPVYWLARKHLAGEPAGARLRARLPALSADPVADAERVPPRRARLPVAAVRDLVPRRGPPRPVRALRGASPPRRKEEIALVVAGLGHLVRARARPPARPEPRSRSPGSRSPLIAIELVIPHFNRAGTSSFFTRYSEVGSTPGGIVHTRGHRPGEDRHDRVHRARARLPGPAALPLGGLALLAPLALVAAVPELAVNLLSAAATQTSIHFHYTRRADPDLDRCDRLRGRSASGRPSARGEPAWSCSASSRTTCSARSRSGATSRAASRRRRTQRR